MNKGRKREQANIEGIEEGICTTRIALDRSFSTEAQVNGNAWRLITKTLQFGIIEAKHQLYLSSVQVLDANASHCQRYS
jgi:hypothetical protein